MPNELISNSAIKIAKLRRQIMTVERIDEALKFLVIADSIEDAMLKAGYRKNTDLIRPANEARFEARWRLGQLLAKVERRHGGDRRSSSRSENLKKDYLLEIGLLW